MLTYTIAYYIPIKCKVDAEVFDRFAARCRQEDVTPHAKVTQLVRDWVAQDDEPTPEPVPA